MKLLYGAVAALVAVVAVIFAAGIVYDNVVRANQAVAQVGPDSITASQLLDEVRPQARRIDAQAKQLGGSSSASDYVNQQKRGLPNQVLDDMIDTRLVAQEAARRGISVSPSDVDDKVRQTVAGFNASMNPTPTEVPTPAADNASASATPGLASTPTAVPTLEDAAYSPALQQLLDQNNLTEPELRTILERSLLQEKVQAAMGEQQVPETDPNQAVPAAQLTSQRQKAFNDWLSSQRSGQDVKLSLDQAQTNWILSRIGMRPESRVATPRLLVPVNEHHAQHLTEQAQHDEHAQHRRETARPRRHRLMERHAPQPGKPRRIEAALQDAQLRKLAPLERPIPWIAARTGEHVR